MKKRERKSCLCGRQFESDETECETCQHRKYLAVWERQVYAPPTYQRAISGIVFGILLLALCISPAFASESINIEKLATAIKMAENSRSKPYGVMLKGCDAKHEAFCKAVCIRTIKNNLRRWENAGNPGDFLSFLQSRYAPLNAKNDPHGLNANWKSNVTYFYNEVL